MSFGVDEHFCGLSVDAVGVDVAVVACCCLLRSLLQLLLSSVCDLLLVFCYVSRFVAVRCLMLFAVRVWRVDRRCCCCVVVLLLLLVIVASCL